MKKLFAALLTFCVVSVFAYENPMNLVRTAKTVEELPAVLAKASADITSSSSVAHRMNLAIAYGLSYLRTTAEPTFAGYMAVIDGQVKVLNIPTDEMNINGGVFDVLRPWWIGKKSNKALLAPAIAWIAEHPHVNLYPKAGTLSYEIGEYAQAVEWYSKMDAGTTYAIEAYAKIGQEDNAIEYFYNKLDSKSWTPESAVKGFKLVWNMILRKSKDDAEYLAKAKARNALYASMYTNYMYESSEPAKSPWRPLITLLTAQSK